jgi:hypothetical protein
MPIDKLTQYAQVMVGDICYVQRNRSSLAIQGRVASVGPNYFEFASLSDSSPSVSGKVLGGELGDVLLIRSCERDKMPGPGILYGENIESLFVEEDVPF